MTRVPGTPEPLPGLDPSRPAAPPHRRNCDESVPRSAAMADSDDPTAAPAADAAALLAAHVERFNAGVATGDWARMLEGFAADAVLAFEGVPVGPFHGRD